MKSVRLLMVIPRFWPHVGDSEIAAGHLADELLRCGSKVTVLSCQWSSTWPATMDVREVPVVRLQHAPRGGWSTLRYMIDLTRWLRRHYQEFDVVYVFSLRYEAYATLVALAHRPISVVLRCQEAGPHGDIAWQSITRFGDRLRARCQTAHAVIAPTQAVAAELEKCGFEPRRTRVIPGGTSGAVERTSDLRFRARNYLAEVNQDLSTADYSPVVAWVGKLNDATPFLPLLKAWRDIAARWPSARLWLIGDGPGRNSLYSQLIDWELQYQVLMPGTFEDLSDVLLAADVYVSPEPFTGTQMILEAMSAGLPILAAESPDLHTMVEHGHNGLIVSAQDHDAWVAAISFLCDNLPLAAKMGGAGQEIIRQKFAAAEMAKRHLELFETLSRMKD